METKYAFLLALMITGLIASNAFLLSLINQSQRETALISRVIDGDTVVLQTGERIRLININTPEKNKQGYEQAKEFLKQFENQTVELEKTDTGKYGRTLARIYVPEYLNLKIIQQGLATKFLVDESEKELFAQAEQTAVREEKGLWKKSPYSSCFESEIFEKEEIIFLKNNCIKINVTSWTLKDESRKEYNFPELILGQVRIHTFTGKNNETDIFWNSNQKIWNNNRDTLYLFDKEKALVHYSLYGY